MHEEDWNYFHDPEFLDSLAQYEAARGEGREPYMDADELTDIAEYYMTIHEDEKATQAIELAQRLHPESVDPQVFLVRQQMFQDNMDEARRLCDAIADQDDQEVRFLRAEMLIREQQPDEASALLEQTYEQVTEDRAGFLHDCVGVFMDYALWEDAKHWVDRLRREFPNYTKGRYLLADVLFAMGQNAQAADELNQMLDRDPYNTEAWNLLAEVQAAQEQFREALDSCEYVLAVQEDNRQAMLTKAHCLCHLYEMAQAHELYQRILRETGPDDLVYYYDALSLINMERFDEAAESLRLANEVGHEMSQEQVHIYIQQAYVESKRHHLPQALQAMDKAMELAENDVTFEYEMLRGQIYLENGHADEAQKLFQQALNKSEDKFHTLLLIGIAYGEVGRYSEAAHLLETLINVYGRPKAEPVIPYLAYCYFHLEEHEPFLNYLKDAVSASRETTEHLFCDIYPNIAPEDYYYYAYKSVYGHFPEEGE